MDEYDQCAIHIDHNFPKSLIKIHEFSAFLLTYPTHNV